VGTTHSRFPLRDVRQRVEDSHVHTVTRVPRGRQLDHHRARIRWFLVTSSVRQRGRRDGASPRMGPDSGVEQPSPRGDGVEDVLSIGQGRTPPWGRLGAVLVVLLLGVAAYRLTSAPATPAAPEADLTAKGPPGWVLVDGGQSSRDGLGRGTALRLDGHLVTLRGPGLQEPDRETSAMVLEPVRRGWLVRLTSTAREGPPNPRPSYGVARTSGRFTLWDANRAGRRPTWRSPDRALVLVARGSQLEVRRTSTSTVVASFPADGSLPPTAR
jgi:hypothetical protein